jgi:hypothetical protein
MTRSATNQRNEPGRRRDPERACRAAAIARTRLTDRHIHTATSRHHRVELCGPREIDASAIVCWVPGSLLTEQG